MARKKPQAKPQAKAQAGAGKRSPMTTLGLAMLFAGLVVVSLPTVILLLVGMLPSIVAYLIDRTPQKYATFCVGGMNFSGVLPYVLDLWMGAHTPSAALSILTDPFALVIMFGSASFGWMIYNSIPPLVVSIMTVMAQRRVAQLRTNQRRIIEEWGEEVAQSIESRH